MDGENKAGKNTNPSPSVTTYQQPYQPTADTNDTNRTHGLSRRHLRRWSTPAPGGASVEDDEDTIRIMEGTLELVFGYGWWSCPGKNIALMELNGVFVEVRLFLGHLRMLVPYGIC